MQGFQELQSQYNHLLQSEPAEQRRFLKELAAQRPKRAARLLRMIGCQTDAIQFFNQRAEDRNDPGRRFLDHFLLQLQKMNQPERIGPYRILETLGSGGMGIVYKAAQEAPLERTVAVKLLAPNAQHSVEETQQLLARETETLAKLKHPGIPQVFEIGISGEQPYLVMEHIEGLPIDAFCRERRLPLQQRIELILQICDTLLYCHGRGVIHGDLKPANVLVTVPHQKNDRPQVKIIDFGIARALANHDGMSHLDQAFASPRGSASYMAPEQAAGDSLADVRNDVFGLGAIFCQLLSGQPPSRAREPEVVPFPSPEDLVQWIEQPLVPPSLVIGRDHDATTGIAEEMGLKHPHLGRILRSELDAFIAKSTHPDPEQRLGNIVLFQNELERFNQNQLMETAKPYGFGLKLQKLWRRNPFQLVTYPLYALLFFSITLGWLFTAEAKEEAVFFNKVLENLLILPHPEHEGSDLRFLDAILKSAERLEPQVAGRPKAAFNFYKILGISLYTNGSYQDASQQFRKMVEAAIKWQGKKSAAYAEAQMYLGKTQEQKGRIAKAFETLTRALELAEQKMSAKDPRLQELRISLASVELARDRNKQAAGHARAAYRQLKKPFVGPKEEQEVWRNLRCQALSKLGAAELKNGRNQESYETLRAAVACHRENGDSDIFTANALHQLAAVLVEHGQTPELKAEALQVGREALAIRLEKTPDHAVTASILHMLAQALQNHGNKTEAVAVAKDALSTMKARTTKTHQSKLKLLEFLIIHDQQDLKTRIQRYRELVQTYIDLKQEHTDDMARALSNFSHYLNKNNQPAEALAALAKAADIRSTLGGDQTKSWLFIQTNQAVAHNLMDNFAQAETILETVVAKLDGIALSDEHKGHIYLALGTARHGLGKNETAVSAFKEAETLLTSNREARKHALEGLIQTLNQTGNRKAADRYRKALEALNQP